MCSVSSRINFHFWHTDSFWVLVEGRRASGDVGDIAKHLLHMESQLHAAKYGRHGIPGEQFFQYSDDVRSGETPVWNGLGCSSGNLN